LLSAQDRMRLCQPRVSGLVLAHVCCNMMIAMPLRNNDSSQFVTGSGDRAEPVEIWKARKLIRDHSDGELSLTEIAKSVNLSANYLSEKFKEVTGVNFVRYVGQTRTAKARDLLRNSNLRISEIAFAVGFQSLSQFNRVFKKLTRKSPTQFREGHKKRKKTINRPVKKSRSRRIYRKNA
jgi:transcriptional regulator GlxA family with amidase domain